MCAIGHLYLSWWRHQMETFPELLALCEGNPPVTGGFPWQRPVTRSFDVFFDWTLNKRWCTHSKRWWSETPSRLLWRHCKDTGIPGFRVPVVAFYDSNLHLHVYKLSSLTSIMVWCLSALSHHRNQCWLNKNRFSILAQVFVMRHIN